jgi:hypothetical protein
MRFELRFNCPHQYFAPIPEQEMEATLRAIAFRRLLVGGAIVVIGATSLAFVADPRQDGPAANRVDLKHWVATAYPIPVSIGDVLARRGR